MWWSLVPVSHGLKPWPWSRVSPKWVPSLSWSTLNPSLTGFRRRTTRTKKSVDGPSITGNLQVWLMHSDTFYSTTQRCKVGFFLWQTDKYNVGMCWKNCINGFQIYLGRAFLCLLGIVYCGELCTYYFEKRNHYIFFRILLIPIIFLLTDLNDITLSIPHSRQWRYDKNLVHSLKSFL